MNAGCMLVRRSFGGRRRSSVVDRFMVLTYIFRAFLEVHASAAGAKTGHLQISVQ
jgi:hypothetical protein